MDFNFYDNKYLKTLQNYSGNSEKLGISGLNVWENIVDWIRIEPKDKDITSLHLQIFGNESVSLQSEVTDNYVESNVAYQDHIALKPMIYTVEGEVGELTWYRNDPQSSFTGAVVQKLEPLVSFAPSVSRVASVAQEKALKIIGVIDSLDNAFSRFWGFLSNDDVDTEQKKVFKYLQALWLQRTPINVKTPWKNLSNYVIQNIEFSQSDRTVDKSKIKISFKEFKTTVTKTTQFDAKKYLGRASAQNAELQNKGVTTGVEMSGGMCKVGQWNCIEGMTQIPPDNDWMPQ